MGGRRGREEDRGEQTRPRLVEFTQAAVTHERVDGAPPGEIGLEQAAVQIAGFPRGVGEPPVPGLRAAVRLARRDLAKLADEPKPLVGGDGRLVGDGLEHGCGASEQILAAQADERIERQRVARSLVGYRLRQIGLWGRLHAHRRSPAGAALPGISRANVSAISAGLSEPSISRVFLVLMTSWPASFGSTPTRTTRSRTRAPALTGARKRTLSRP